jgi:hypothetical protein
MKKFLVLFIGIFLFIGCSNESRELNEILKNERLMIEHSIDSLKNERRIVIAFNDSLFLVNKDIMENMESAERNNRLMNERKQIESDIFSFRNINENLKRQNNVLNEQINKNKFALDVSKNIYIVKIKIHQTTYSLDLGEYIKNKINDIEFEIPVDKAYYDKCSIGQKITDPGLKIGSLIMDGDFSKLNIIIINKRTVRR